MDNLLTPSQNYMAFPTSGHQLRVVLVTKKMLQLQNYQISLRVHAHVRVKRLKWT